MAGRILFVLIAIISLNTGILNETNAEDKEVATPQHGLPVTLRVGPGFSRIHAAGIADDLRAEGCPTVVTSERGFPGHMSAGFGEHYFRSTSAGSVGAYTLKYCLKGKKPSFLID